MVRLYEEIKKGGRREEKYREKVVVSNFYVKKKQSISILKRELTEIAIARCTLRRISAADIFFWVLKKILKF